MNDARENARKNNVLADMSLEEEIFVGDEPESQRLARAVRRRRSSADPQEIEALNEEIKALTEQLSSALVKDGDTYRFRRFQMTMTSLIAPAELSQEEADEFGALLGGMDDALNWWRGGWANLYVEGIEDDNERGKIYDQLAELFNMNSRTLRNCASIDRNVQVSRRRDTLSFSHHVEVAALGPDEQAYWLDRAEQGEDGKRWSVKQLRQAIAQSKQVALPAPDVSQVIASAFARRKAADDKLIEQGASASQLIEYYEQRIAELKGQR